MQYFILCMCIWDILEDAHQGAFKRVKLSYVRTWGEGVYWKGGLLAGDYSNTVARAASQLGGI